MLFNSYIFIFVFLPITLIGYFALNHFHQNKIAKVWLVICSLFFYAYYNVAYLWVILASMVVNYVLCYAFNKLNKSKTGLRRFLFVLGSFINIGALFFYKYLDARGHQLLHFPADRLFSRQLQRQSACIQRCGLCFVCNLLSSADSGTDRIT